MKHIALVRLIFLLIICASASSAVAQSRERDHPRQLRSNELTGDLDGTGDEYFYSFVAGPGEIKITVDVTSSDGTSNMEFELLDKDAAKQILCCAFAQADSTGESGRTIKTVKLARRQIVVLRLIQGKVGSGTYRVRLGGAVSLEGTEGDQ